MEIIHHATLLYDNEVDTAYKKELLTFSEVFDNSYEKLGIDDARGLIQAANTTSSENGFKLIVVRTRFVTHEAQNSLLKILEETPETAKFLFIVPFGFQMLPTLASRFFVEDSGRAAKDIDNSSLLEFINLSYKDRITKIEKSQKDKDVAWQQKIKQGLISSVESGEIKTTKEIEFIARFLLTRGASNKLLLEHLALLLPVR